MRHLLLVGAYRDNEVDPAHPLRQTLDACARRARTCRRSRLRRSPTRTWGGSSRTRFAAAGPCRPARATGAREDGRQSFFRHSVRLFARRRGAARFDHDAARWRWDLDRIHAKGYTDNVVDLMVGKLARLPAEPRPRCSSSPASATAPRSRRFRSSSGNRTRTSVRISGTPCVWSWSSTRRARTSSSTIASRRPPIR